MPQFNQVLVIPFVGHVGTLFEELLTRDATRLSDSAAFSQEESEWVANESSDAVDNTRLIHDINKAYAQELEYFFEDLHLSLPLVFDRMDSPKEYNFTNDVLFCRTTQKAVLKLYRSCNRTILADIIRSRFTSRSGFESFYSADLLEWILGKGRLEFQSPEHTLCGVKFWDPNQLETLIISVLLSHEVTLSELEDLMFSRVEDIQYQGSLGAHDYLLQNDAAKKLESLIEKDRIFSESLFFSGAVS